MILVVVLSEIPVVETASLTLVVPPDRSDFLIVSRLLQLSPLVCEEYRSENDTSMSLLYRNN